MYEYDKGSLKSIRLPFNSKNSRVSGYSCYAMTFHYLDPGCNCNGFKVPDHWSSAIRTYCTFVAQDDYEPVFGNQNNDGGDVFIPYAGSGGGGGVSSDYLPKQCTDQINPSNRLPDGLSYAIPCDQQVMHITPITINPNTSAYNKMLHTFLENGYMPNISQLPLLTEEQAQKLNSLMATSEDNDAMVNLTFWGFEEVSTGRISWPDFDKVFTQTQERINYAKTAAKLIKQDIYVKWDYAYKAGVKSMEK